VNSLRKTPPDSMQDRKYRELEKILPGVSRETFERLLAYEALFIKWSKAINLAAPSTLAEFWQRHVLDSAQLAAIHEPAGIWVDIGSGGGLPGIVMSILLRDSSAGLIHLVESNGKKAAFLRQALIETGGAGQVHILRIEDAYPEIGPAAVVTSRALAPLPALISLAHPWLRGGARGLFHKGREYREEVKAASDEWHLDLIEHPSTVDAASAILEIRSASPRLRD
jgi:16S rRNA (guanine527-N7)-methyltransferase